MKLEIRRGPLTSGGSWSRNQKTYNADISVQHHFMMDYPGYLSIDFSSGGASNRSLFRGTLSGVKEFSEIAKMMVEADPEAAVKAFSAALLDLTFPKPPERKKSTFGFGFSTGLKSPAAEDESSRSESPRETQ